MNVKRTIIAAALLSISATPAFAQQLDPATLKVGPIGISGQFEYSVSDREGVTEQGDHIHRQRSHPGVLLGFGSVIPLKGTDITTELFVSTKLVSGDANPSWTNSFGNREAWGGLNGNFGKVRFGRQWIDTYINIMDPYASGGNVGEMSEIGTGAGKGYPAGLTRISNAIWADNSMTYTSQKLGNMVTLRAQYYWNGTSFSDETLANAQSPNIAPNTKGANGYILAARADLPMVRIDASYGSQKQNLKDAKATSDSSALANGVYNSTQLVLGAIVPVGAHSVRALINKDTTDLVGGKSISDTEFVFGGQIAVTKEFHIRPVYINHKVDSVANDAADYSQIRAEFGYKFNIGEQYGSTTLWARPMVRKWKTSGEKFTEIRVGFTSNF
jgi:hypothetical protein